MTVTGVERPLRGGESGIDELTTATSASFTPRASYGSGDIRLPGLGVYR
jgi:hypothetical protein